MIIIIKSELTSINLPQRLTLYPPSDPPTGLYKTYPCKTSEDKSTNCHFEEECLTPGHLALHLSQYITVLSRSSLSACRNILCKGNRLVGNTSWQDLSCSILMPLWLPRAANSPVFQGYSPHSCTLAHTSEKQAQHY